MKAILPVAGSGTRMYPLGITTPKCLIKILNKPVLEWSLEALEGTQIDEVIIVVSAGTFGQTIREYVEEKIIAPHKYSFTIKLGIQEQQLGTAHVVQMAKDFFEPGEQFLFMYGDDLYGPETINQTLSTSELAVVGMKVTDPEKWGIFQADENNNLMNVIEKPDTFVGDLANIGCMKLNTRVFELFDQLSVSVRGEYELTDSLQLLAQETTVKVLPTLDYWIPIGYPWHILDATEYFLPLLESKIEGRVEDNVIIKGNLVLPESSRILEGSIIEGNILVGNNVIIGPNAHIRGNTTIGNDSFIGFGVELKNSVVGERCRLPHLSYIGDSVIGDDVNIAGGCMIANFRHDGATVQTPIKGKMVDTQRRKLGCILGDGVKLGVNTSVYPGRKIWPHLTTRPGQIVDKDLTE